MRIIYVTNSFPYPLTSGYLRHYFLIRELARHHHVTLLSITGASFMDEHAAALAPFTERVLTFPRERKSGSLNRNAIRRLRLLVRGDEAVRRMRGALERLLHEQPFDLMLFSGKRTFPAIAQLPLPPLVADLCDATSLHIHGSMRYAGLSKLPQLLLEYQQVCHVERTLARSAAHLLFASYRDREALLGLGTAPASVVPNGVDLEFWRRSSGELGADTIVFTGAMDYPPNTDAALVLIREILPLVRRRVPDARALIVGRDPPPRLVRAGDQQGVHVTGYVEDVRPFLEQATVFVAPLRFGAGIQNKVLEAMAMEVPVVASPIAADGVRAEGSKQAPVEVAHEAPQFAELITRQLAKRVTTAAPDSEPRRYVERHFVWRRSGELLEQVIAELVPTAATRGVVSTARSQSDVR